MHVGDSQSYLSISKDAVPFQQNIIESSLGEFSQGDDKYFGEFTDIGIEQLIAMGIPVTKIEGTFERNGKVAHKVYINGLFE
ncbi:hypothetical protein M0R01_04170 [bacterium]|nr:hypothetical protein [bacterium]